MKNNKPEYNNEKAKVKVKRIIIEYLRNDYFFHFIIPRNSVVDIGNKIVFIIKNFDFFYGQGLERIKNGLFELLKSHSYTINNINIEKIDFKNREIKLNIKLIKLR